MNTTTYQSGFWTDSFISDEVSYIVSSIILKSVLQVILRIFGSLTNIANVVVFIKLGLSDSATVSFVGLAVADLAYLLIFLVSLITDIVEKHFEIHPHVNLRFVGLAIIYYSMMFLDISTIITMFISVQKACCVAIPFLFNNIFTFRKGTLCVIGIYIGVFLYYCPIHTIMILDFGPVYSRRSEDIRIEFTFSAALLQVINLHSTISKNILPILAQATILFSLVVMSRHLKKSVRFRHFMLSTPQGRRRLTRRGGTERRERRVIQSVLTLSVIFVASNTPVVMIFLSHYIITTFLGLHFPLTLFQLCADISDTLFILHSSVNILVYLKFNSRYRQRFLALFMTRCPSWED